MYYYLKFFMINFTRNRGLLVLLVLLMLSKTLFSQESIGGILIIDTARINREYVLNKDQLLSDEVNRIYLFISPSKQYKENYVTNFSMEISTPENVEIYNFDNLNGGIASAIYPNSYKKSISKHKLVYSFPKNEKLTYSHPAEFYFYILPVGIGTGYINYKMSWKDESGNYHNKEIKGNRVTVQEAPEIKWSLCHFGNSYKLRAQYIYKHDYVSFLSEQAKINLLLKNGNKEYRLTSFEIPKNINLQSKLSIEGTAKLGKTIWKFNQKNIKIEENCQNINEERNLNNDLVNSTTSECSQFFISTLNINGTLKLSWSDPKYNGTDNYVIYRRKISRNKENIYKDEVIGTVNKQTFIDTLFYVLSDKSYYIYLIKKEKGNIYSCSLPVFIEKPIGFRPRFTLKYFELEMGYGFNYINHSYKSLYYFQVGIGKIKFNEKFNILPLNLRVVSQFNKDIETNLVGYFEFKPQNNFSIRFGGGLHSLYSKSYSQISYGSLIEISLNATLLNKEFGSIGFSISGKYTSSLDYVNYSGLYVGLKYKL